MPVLEYRDSTGRPAKWTLGPAAVVIGRSPDCDIVLSSASVSRRHAVIHLERDTWVVEDVGSSFGTFVNRQRVQKRALAAGDEIGIGDVTMRVVDPTALRPATSPGEAHPKTHPATSPGVPAHPEVLQSLALDSGRLVQTIFGARRVDVAQLTATDASVADLMAVPSAVAGRPAASDEARGASPSDTAGAEAAAAARLETEIAGHLLALVRISDELRRCTDVHAVCAATVDMAMRATRADRGVLALRTTPTSVPETTSPGGGGGAVLHASDFEPRVQVQSVRGPSAEPGRGDVRVSRTFVEKVIRERIALSAVDTGDDASLAEARSILALDIRSILCAPLWDGEDIVGYLYLDNVGMGRRFRQEDLDLATALGHLAASEITRLRLVERVRDEEMRRQQLGRFLSADVIRHIEEEARAGRLDPTQSAREQEVTILFSDIAGFTSLSERMHPAHVKHFLDGYFERMTEILVDRFGGTLDKYIGDGIMALFGAPFESTVDGDAVRAVSAAVEMRDAVAQMQRERPEYAALNVRIGVNTGRVISGMLGSRRRLEYSVVGDAVNVASRLESTGEPGRIQIGEATRRAIGDSFEVEFAGERIVKNRSEAVRAWWVVGRRG